MKRWIWLVAGLAISVVVILIAATAFTPGQTNPAFAAAEAFANAAGKGDEATAFALLAPAAQDYVRENCPDGRVSACVDAYTPPEWGGLMSAVFRRAVPDGNAWNVDLIATWERDRGFSGVCIYTRMEADDAGAWRVAEYAGFVHCGDQASRNMANNPDAPNRVP
jgi:hypothetical protein